MHSTASGDFQKNLSSPRINHILTNTETAMSTKRQAPSDHNTNNHPAPSWKRRKPNHTNNPHHAARPNHGKNAYKKAHPVNTLKSTIRSLRRLLARDAADGEESLPASIRVEKERELQTAEHELRRAQAASRRSEMIGRWHKARFFERQKADRRLRKARAEVQEAGEDPGRLEELRARVADAEVDLNYALFFPLERPYVSLFRSRREKEMGNGVGVDAGQAQAEEERLGDPEMWQLVKACMADGTLKDLREGRLRTEVEAESGAATELKSGLRTKSKIKPEKKGKEAAVQKKTTARRGGDGMQEDEAGNESSDNESGGGFFE